MTAAAPRWIELPVRAGRFALDAVLPQRCLSCDRRVAPEGGLCAQCWQEIRFFEKPWCYRLGTPFSYDVGEEAWSPQAIASPPVFGRLRSVAPYEGPARDLVHALKFHGRRNLARPMGSWMARQGSEFLGPDSLIVPVPLHWLRLLSRRFNQSADLARAIAEECGGHYEPALLKRRKRTRQQVGLSAEARRKNVRAAFGLDEARPGDVRERKVVLVDDVVTTGSTVAACSRVLLNAGAASVDVLAFAYARPSDG
ncbi:ComF family protein [Roseibium aggregatum]|uniref:ComF family protein n=1 Tax=Roseibium aggregatum TaxID=187304 RepID=A0A939ELE8_9HYPH|nr:ComF family protein [Roseibium aggregatum]MBN9673944.1 ComF family protein [Roseibium aggregatum]